MAQALVDHPGQVFVNEIHSGDTVVHELAVSKSDIGQVIGKRQDRRCNQDPSGCNGWEDPKKFMLEIVE